MFSLAKLSALIPFFGGNESVQGLPLSNRNYIVDGNFDSIISGTVPLTSAQATHNAATMYYIGVGTGGVGNAFANPTGFSGDEPLGMTSPVHGVASLQLTTPSSGNIAARSLPFILQAVEDVMTLQGRSSTFSFWAWVASGSVNIQNLAVAQVFGSGGSPSPAAYYDPAVNMAVTTTKKRFSVRIDWPSVLGKMLGTNKDSCIQVGFFLPAGFTGQIITSQWQLEQSSPQSSPDLTGKGGAPTAFEYRGPQAELARVQRQYEFGNIITAGTASAAGTYNPPVTYKVTKRAGPAVTFARQSQGGVLTAAATGITFGLSGTDGFTASYTISGAGGFNSYEVYTADARL